MDEEASRYAMSDDRHAEALSRSMEELQRIVQEHEEALRRLREAPSRAQPAAAASRAKASLEVQKAGYEDAAQSEPFLPSPDSVLPALLAMRKTHDIIAESRAYLASQKVSLDEAKKRLEIEQANLNDQKLLQEALQRRIESLRSGLEVEVEMTPEQIAKEKLDQMRREKHDYDKDTTKLLKTLNKFIDETLAPMLAAEELGGPVVGELMDVEAEQLEAGFNAQGKPKKPRANADEDKRQRRIDDIWGTGGEGQRRQSRGSRLDETAAAAADMRDLLEQLLNRLMGSGGDGSAAYVEIPRESASARFLVRSKVAQFHPKDATRLRLVDFGRELDD